MPAVRIWQLPESAKSDCIWLRARQKKRQMPAIARRRKLRAHCRGWSTIRRNHAGFDVAFTLRRETDDGSIIEQASRKRRNPARQQELRTRARARRRLS